MATGHQVGLLLAEMGSQRLVDVSKKADDILGSLGGPMDYSAMQRGLPVSSIGSFRSVVC